MNRLIINTANDSLYVVLNCDGKFFSQIITSRVKHNEALIGCIDELLNEASIKLKDLNELAVVIGPGSFTGIRVGIATIKAFRDALNIKAVGINNLDLLFALAKRANKSTTVVAIKGSQDSYFVAREVNGMVYKYDHNISEKELIKIANGSKIGMFVESEELNSFAVKYDDKIIDELCKNSTDYDLIPVYYQLSQAEREKQNNLNFEIKKYTKKDFQSILNIERSCISYCALNEKQLKDMLNSNNYVTFVAKCEDKIVGFVLAELTDEVNITSLAVDGEYRNLGLATRLIEKLISFSKRAKFPTISLEVKKDNIGAYLLYDKFGFKVRRIRKKYYSDNMDCLEMCLNID